MEKKLKDEEISFEYKISPNYSLVPVSGGHGGLSVQGDIVLNLFYERHPIPKTVTHKIDEFGLPEEPPVAVEIKDSFIREVLFGLVLKPAAARGLAGWLNNQADEFEKK